MYSYRHNERYGTTTIYRNNDNYTRDVLCVLGAIEVDEDVLLEMAAELDYHEKSASLLRKKIELIKRLQSD